MSESKTVIAITGASGSIYAKLLLNELMLLNVAAAVVFSKKGKEVWQYELNKESLTSIPFPIYEFDDFFAPFASGSSDFKRMIVCPCSMGTLGRIASGTSDDLISRAADVMLKERRQLILVTRETPLSLIHINNMKTVTESGGIILPASPSFYSRPYDIEQVAMTVVNRILSLSGFDNGSYKWGTVNS
jgi:flavin prenyltransferase